MSVCMIGVLCVWAEGKSTREIDALHPSFHLTPATLELKLVYLMSYRCAEGHRDGPEAEVVPCAAAAVAKGSASPLQVQ